MADRPYVELSIEGIRARDVLSLRGKEKISELFEYEIEVEVLPPLPDLATLMGKRAEIRLRSMGGQERLLTGIVAEAQVLARDTDDIVRGKFVVRPAVYRQKLGRDCWSSQDVTVLDVVKSVLADYPGTIRYDIGGSYPEYPYRVQYREDDWTYLSRILEEEGIYYWFDHGNGFDVGEGESELVFSDDSTSSPMIEGIPLLQYTPASQMRPDQEAVTEVSFFASAQSHRFSARSFDMARPAFRVEANVGKGQHEIYDAPGAGPTDPAVLKSRVRVGLESARSHRSGIQGLVSSARIFPGRSFTIFGHPVGALSGTFFVTEIEIVGNAKVGISSRFSAIVRDVPFRPLRVSKEAKQAGLQMGFVVGPDGQEVHPDEHGRIRVQMHWDRLGPGNEKGGTWCRVAQRGTPGSMLLPRMGWNVATFNEEGGVDAPSLICRIHDADHPPEYSLPANKTRVVYKTATTPGGGPFNEIYFEDNAGAEEMFIHASKDMNMRTLNRKTEVVKNDSLRVVGNENVIHTDADMVDRVLENQTVTVAGNEELTVQGRHSKTVNQNETRNIAGSRSLKVGDSYVTSVDGNRNLDVGAAMLDLTLGNVTTTGNHTLAMVGGAIVRVGVGNMSEDTAKVAIQAVGGAKVEIAKENRPTDVGVAMKEIVGGAMILKSNGRYLDNADTTASWTVLGPLDADAPKVRIEAEQKITIRCGGSKLVIDGEQIKIEAESLDLSGAHIDADTGKITHN